MNATDRLLTPKQIAARLHLHVATVYRWIFQGRLPAARPGPRCYLVRIEDLDRMLTPATPAIEKTRQRLARETREAGIRRRFTEAALRRMGLVG